MNNYSSKLELVLTDPLDEADWPQIFFKDILGKQHHVPIKVRLLNSDGHSSRVSLKLTLKYEDRTVVPAQDIMSLVAPNAEGRAVELDDRSEAVLHLRIDEVSKNHRSQSFVVFIEAQIHGRTVASVYSQPIRVLSKPKDEHRSSGTKRKPAQRTQGPRPQKQQKQQPHRAKKSQQSQQQQQLQQQQQQQQQAKRSQRRQQAQQQQQQQPTTVPQLPSDVQKASSKLQEARALLQQSEWLRVSPDTSTSSDSSIKATPERCFSCGGMRLGSGHAVGCSLQSLLQQLNQHPDIAATHNDSTAYSAAAGAAAAAAAGSSCNTGNDSDYSNGSDDSEEDYGSDDDEEYCDRSAAASSSCSGSGSASQRHQRTLRSTAAAAGSAAAAASATTDRDRERGSPRRHVAVGPPPLMSFSGASTFTSGSGNSSNSSSSMFSTSTAALIPPLSAMAAVGAQEQFQSFDVVHGLLDIDSSSSSIGRSTAGAAFFGGAAAPVTFDPASPLPPLLPQRRASLEVLDRVDTAEFLTFYNNETRDPSL